MELKTGILLLAFTSKMGYKCTIIAKMFDFLYFSKE